MYVIYHMYIICMQASCSILKLWSLLGWLAIFCCRSPHRFVCASSKPTEPICGLYSHYGEWNLVSISWTRIIWWDKKITQRSRSPRAPSGRFHISHFTWFNMQYTFHSLLQTIPSTPFFQTTVDIDKWRAVFFKCFFLLSNSAYQNI